MEDIVALAVHLENGEKRYFMTWGRISRYCRPRTFGAVNFTALH